MTHDLSIREHNWKPHTDIEQDISSKKNGLFSFVLRVNAGNIVDYVLIEHSDASEYQGFIKVFTQEFTASYSYRK